MRERILIACVAGFLLGVFYASFFPLSLPLIVAALGSAAIFLLAAHIGHNDQYPIISVFFLCACVIGATRFDVGRVAHDPQFAGRVGQHVNVEGRVVEEPDVREKSTRLTIRVTTVDGTAFNGSEFVLAVTPAFTQVSYGDEVALSGVIKIPEPFESGTGRSFNYPQYLAAHNISYEIDFARATVHAHGGNPLVRAALAIKSIYISGLRAVLPEPYAGLAAGITAGDKRSVGSELSDVFMRVSLIHILVLSGYNITVVMSVLLRLCSRVPRVPKLMISLGTVAFFILISGGAPSAVRAGAMAYAAVFANMYGRQFIALRVLFAIIVGMVAWNPYILAFDPGFQLSVLATIGLILFAGPMSEYLYFVPERFGMREIIAATLSTQLAVLPLLLYQNGILSLVALPTNVLALVAVPLAMGFSAVAAIAGVIAGSWGVLFALPAYILLRYIVFVADTFASFPFAAVQVPAFNAYVLALVYVGLFGGYWWVATRARLMQA